MNEITKIHPEVVDEKSQSEIQNKIAKIIEELASGINRINQTAGDVDAELKSVEGKSGLFSGGNKENINVLKKSLSITQGSMRWITELISKNTELNFLAIRYAQLHVGTLSAALKEGFLKNNTSIGGQSEDNQKLLGMILKNTDEFVDNAMETDRRIESTENKIEFLGKLLEKYATEDELENLNSELESAKNQFEGKISSLESKAETFANKDDFEKRNAELESRIDSCAQNSELQELKSQFEAAKNNSNDSIENLNSSIASVKSELKKLVAKPSEQKTKSAAWKIFSVFALVISIISILLQTIIK